MGMIVQHNMSSINANRNLGIVSGALSKSTEKLSSGYKINRAGDNAAGLAISEKMRGQIRGLDQASSNSEDGISLIQTAEGALTETHSILQRMRELAVQAASDTNTDDDRTQIQNEIDQLTSEVDRIATTTEFNSKKLLDGSRTGSVSQKDGKTSVEGTFGNSNVSASITSNNASKAGYTDIIRVEVTEDFEAGKSTKSSPKYTDAELKAAYDKVEGKKGAAVTLDKAIEEALKDDKTALKTAQGTYDKSADAIATNKEAVNTFLEGINTDTLADGKTIEDVKAALNKLVNAYTTSGQTGSAAPTDIATAITDLESLFIADADTTVVGSTAAEPIALVDNQGGADPLSTTAGKTKLGDLSKEYKTVLKAAAVKMADVGIQNKADSKAVDDAQRNVDLLSNTDLIKAKYEYESASAAKTGAAGDKAAEDIAQANMDAAMDKINELNADKSVITVTDLFGNSDSSKNFEIASKVADDGTLTITLKNSDDSTDDTVITIENADKLKAGDVITITSEKMTESKQAATGEEALRLQVGANAGQEVALGINSMKAKDLSIVQTKEGSEGKALDVTSQSSASMAVNAYDLAIQKVSTERAKMGAVQNRLEHTISNLDTAGENLQTAESRIRDTDMAEEMTQYSKNNILMQAGQSMLAQANQSTQGVLSLLQ